MHPAETFTQPLFTLSNVVCPDPTYTSVEQGQGAHPTPITAFTATSLDYTVDSSLNSDAGAYIIEVTASYADGTTVSSTFTLTLETCDIISVAPSD